MVKRVVAKQAKGCDGTLVSRPKAVGGVMATGSVGFDTPAKAIARAKALGSRQRKSASKMVDKGLSNLVEVTRNLDMDFITEWISQRPHMVGFISGIMRNGLLEKNYMDSFNKPQASSSQLGVRMFTDGSLKWRGLRGSAAPSFLASLLQRPEIPDWFKGQERLPLVVATKALRFALGVDESTDVPAGHVHGAFYGPLLFLAKQRLAEIGNRLENTTKQTLEDGCDFFMLDEDSKILSNTNRQTQILFKGIAMTAAEDWCIVDGHSYIQAKLVSVDADVETSIARAFERSHEVPMYNTPLHFSNGVEVPGFPDDTPCTPPRAASRTASGGGASTPLQAFVPLPPP